MKHAMQRLPLTFLGDDNYQLNPALTTMVKANVLKHTLIILFNATILKGMQIVYLVEMYEIFVLII